MQDGDYIEIYADVVKITDTKKAQYQHGFPDGKPTSITSERIATLNLGSNENLEIPADCGMEVGDQVTLTITPRK